MGSEHSSEVDGGARQGCVSSPSRKMCLFVKRRKSVPGRQCRTPFHGCVTASALNTGPGAWLRSPGLLCRPRRARGGKAARFHLRYPGGQGYHYNLPVRFAVRKTYVLPVSVNPSAQHVGPVPLLSASAGFYVRDLGCGNLCAAAGMCSGYPGPSGPFAAPEQPKDAPVDLRVGQSCVLQALSCRLVKNPRKFGSGGG